MGFGVLINCRRDPRRENDEYTRSSLNLSEEMTHFILKHIPYSSEWYSLGKYQVAKLDTTTDSTTAKMILDLLYTNYDINRAENSHGRMPLYSKGVYIMMNKSGDYPPFPIPKIPSDDDVQLYIRENSPLKYPNDYKVLFTLFPRSHYTKKYHGFEDFIISSEVPYSGETKNITYSVIENLGDHCISVVRSGKYAKSCVWKKSKSKHRYSIFQIFTGELRKVGWRIDSYDVVTEFVQYFECSKTVRKSNNIMMAV